MNTELRKRKAELRAAASIMDARPMAPGRKAYLEARTEKKRLRAADLPMELAADGGIRGWRAATEAAAAGAGGAGGAGSAAAAAAAAGEGTAPPVAGMKRGRGALTAAAVPTPGAGGAPSAAAVAAATALADSRSSAMRPRATEFPVDVVRFGERAEAPPVLTVGPRKSKKQREAELLAKLRRGAAFAEAAGDEAGAGKAAAATDAAAEEEADEAAAAAAAARKARAQTIQMEKLRADAVAAYAQLKRKRAAERAAGGGGGYGSSL